MLVKVAHRTSLTLRSQWLPPTSATRPSLGLLGDRRPTRSGGSTHHSAPFSSPAHHRRGQPQRAATRMAATEAKILVVSGPDSPELKVLEGLPAGAEVVGVGKNEKDLAHLSEDQWSSINVLLNCGVGARAGTKSDIQALWPRLPSLVWMHSASAGLEHLLFPDLVSSPVVLTNAKGVYSHSLAEFTLFACKYFGLNFPRIATNQRAHVWQPFDVEELRGKTMGVVGYGDIGQACARLARAFKMRVVALRRRTELSEAEQKEGLVDKLYSPSQLKELMAVSDYVVVATPFTPQTYHLVNAEAISHMKPTAVIVNVGRGKCIEEEALIKALQENKIRGAALDVMETEPLPEDSPLWDLPNVILTPHCADRTTNFQVDSLEFFVENMGNFVAGKSLLNIVDKTSGY